MYRRFIFESFRLAASSTTRPLMASSACERSGTSSRRPRAHRRATVFGLKASPALKPVGGVAIADMTYTRLNKPLKDQFDKFEVGVGEIVESTNDEITVLFARLQMGMPLNPAETAQRRFGADACHHPAYDEIARVLHGHEDHGRSDQALRLRHLRLRHCGRWGRKGYEINRSARATVGVQSEADGGNHGVVGQGWRRA